MLHFPNTFWGGFFRGILIGNVVGVPLCAIAYVLTEVLT